MRELTRRSLLQQTGSVAAATAVGSLLPAGWHRLITSRIGGNSNSTTGDSSVGIIGRLFEKGEFTQAVAEMNIAGNHLEFWPKLAEVANDPWPYSSMRTPSLVFTDVVVSGV